MLTKKEERDQKLYEKFKRRGNISRLEHEGEAAKESTGQGEDAKGVSELQRCSSCAGIRRCSRGALRR